MVISLVVGPAFVAACSSSGGGVSQSKLESKIKSEQSIQTVLKQGGAKAQVASLLVGCIAKALEKDADPADLKKYVAGKLNINDVGAKSKGADNNAQAAVKSCATTVIHKASSSAAHS